jgi:hypothetical protein
LNPTFTRKDPFIEHPLILPLESGPVRLNPGPVWGRAQNHCNELPLPAGEGEGLGAIGVWG